MKRLLVTLMVVVLGWYGSMAHAGSYVLLDDRSVAFGSITAEGFTGPPASVAAAMTRHRIVVNSHGNGLVSPAGAIEIGQGGLQSFAFLPAAGYRVSAIRVDGELCEAVDSYTFINVGADHAIEVIFTEDKESPYTLVTRR